MAKVKYRISKITEEGDWNTLDISYTVYGYHITLTNVDNPFDFLVEYVPREAYTEEEFAVGRIVELEDDDDE